MMERGYGKNSMRIIYPTVEANAIITTTVIKKIPLNAP